MANSLDIWRGFDRDFIPPFTSWRPLLRRLDDMFSEVMDTSSVPGLMGERTFVPALDLDETDNHYIVSFDMPGLDKKDIDIEVQGNQLIVSGERNEENKVNEGRSRVVERRYGRFERALTLPEGIKAEEVEADYQNGVLKVQIPKAAEAKRAKVKIGEGKSGLFRALTGKKKNGEKEQGKEPIKIRDAGEAQQSAAR